MPVFAVWAAVALFFVAPIIISIEDQRQPKPVAKASGFAVRHYPAYFVAFDAAFDHQADFSFALTI
jgi:hypothetical protein